MSHSHNPAFTERANRAKANIKEVSIDTVRDKLTVLGVLESGKEEEGKAGEGERGAVVLVDVRELDEVAGGSIPSAIHIGKGVLERDIETKVPDKDAEIILFCNGGNRSAIAAESIQQMGYTNVFSMEGGYKGWREAGLPLSK